MANVLTANFATAVANGWPTADTGQDFTLVGTLADFDSAGGYGTIALAAGAATHRAHVDLALANQSIVWQGSLDKTPVGGNTQIYIVGRMSADFNDRYQVQVRATPAGLVSLFLMRVVAGTATTIGQIDTAFTPTQEIKVRFEMSGTSFSVRAWDAGASEPGTWDISATDNAGPQGAGLTGLMYFIATAITNGPVTMKTNAFTVDDVGTNPGGGTTPPPGGTATGEVWRTASLNELGVAMPDAQTAQRYALGQNADGTQYGHMVVIIENPFGNSVYPYGDDMKAANANLFLLLYGKSVHYQHSTRNGRNPITPGQVYSFPEDWISHSGNPATVNNRVTVNNPTTYIMNPTSTSSWTDLDGIGGKVGAVYAGWTAFHKALVLADINRENGRYTNSDPIDGGWGDSAGTYSLHGQVVPGTTTKYTATTWLPLVVDDQRDIKAHIAPRPWWDNGIDSNPALVAADVSDGGMAETPLRAATQAATSFWKDSTLVADCNSALSRQAKLPGYFVQWLVKIWTSDSLQAKEKVRRAVVALYYMVNNGSMLLQVNADQSTADWNLPHGPSYRQNLGTPLESFTDITQARVKTVKDSTGTILGYVYMRRYQKGVALYNSAGVSTSVPLPRSDLTTLDGAAAGTTITLAANEGQLLWSNTSVGGGSKPANTVAPSANGGTSGGTLTTYASDDYSDTQATGWANADTGGAWTIPTGLGVAADYAKVGGSFGTISHATGTTKMIVLAVGQADVDITANVSFPALATGGNEEIRVVARRNSNTFYSIALDLLSARSGVVQSGLYSTVSNVQTALTGGLADTLTGYTAASGIKVRFQVQGTTLKAKVWLAANAEPATWLYTITDTSISGAGDVGIRTFRGAANTNASPQYRVINFLTTSITVGGGSTLPAPTTLGATALGADGTWSNSPTSFQRKWQVMTPGTTVKQPPQGLYRAGVSDPTNAIPSAYQQGAFGGFTLYLNWNDLEPTQSGTTRFDGAMTAGSATLTAAGASFVAGDVGKRIMVRGAGPGGVALYGTITARTSATVVTLSKAASTTASNQRFTYGHALDTTTAALITSAQTNAQALGVDFKIRLFAGYLSPSWLQTIVGTFRAANSQDKDAQGIPIVHVMPKFWSPVFLDYYERLLMMIAEIADAMPEFSDITISAAMTRYAEPFIRDLTGSATVAGVTYPTGARNRAELVGGGQGWATDGTANGGANIAVPGAGYTDAANTAAHKRAIDAHARAFPNTGSSVAYNPGQTIQSYSTYQTANTAYSNSIMDYQRQQLGVRGILENNSARPSYFTYDASGKATGLSTGAYPDMYSHMIALGNPIFIQTANSGNIGDLSQTLDAVENIIGANAVEPPTDFQAQWNGGDPDYSPSVFKTATLALAANPTGVTTTAGTPRDIAGATDTSYILTQPGVFAGDEYRLAVKATNQYGTSDWAYSAWYGPLTDSGGGSNPQPLINPGMSGQPYVGESIMGTVASWDKETTADDWKWQRATPDPVSGAPGSPSDYIPYASTFALLDYFNRTVAAGNWSGGWAVPYSNPSAFSVDGDLGVVTASAAVTYGIAYPTEQESAVNLGIRFEVNQAPTGNAVYLQARINYLSTASGSGYIARAILGTGSTWTLELLKVTAGVATTLTSVIGVRPFTANEKLRLHVQSTVNGAMSLTLHGADEAEPPPQLTYTDATYAGQAGDGLRLEVVPQSGISNTTTWKFTSVRVASQSVLTLFIGDDLRGQMIRPVERGTNASGFTEAFGTWSQPISDPPLQPPSPVSYPQVEPFQDIVSGMVLTLTNGLDVSDWLGITDPSQLTPVWRRVTDLGAGATAEADLPSGVISYTTTDSDIGSHIQGGVQATNDAGTITAWDDPTDPVGAAPSTAAIFIPTTTYRFTITNRDGTVYASVEDDLAGAERWFEVNIEGEPASAGFTADMLKPLAADLEEGYHRLKVYRNYDAGGLVFHGKIWSIEEDTETGRMTVVAFDQLQQWQYDNMNSSDDDEVRYKKTAGWNAASIMDDIVDRSQGQTHYEITSRRMPGQTFKPLGRKFPGETTLLDAYKSLVQLKSLDVIAQPVEGTILVRQPDEYPILIERITELQLYSDLGGNTDVVFGYGAGPRNVQRVSRVRDFSRRRNRSVAVGGSVGPKKPNRVGTAVDATSVQKFGVMQDLESYPDVKDPDELDQRAHLNLNRKVWSYTFVPAPNGPQMFDDFDLGDTIRFIAKKGSLQVDDRFRITRAHIDIDQDNRAQLGELSIGDTDA